MEPQPYRGERISAAPFIPAAVDPEIEAARVEAAARASGAPPDGRAPAPDVAYRVVALLIDAVVFIGLMAAARSIVPDLTIPPVVAVGLWLALRVVPQVAFGHTLGQFLLGYSVLGPRDSRLGFFRALAREALLATGAAFFYFAFVFGAALWSREGESPRTSPRDPHLPHDALTDCWPVATR